jgi:hypothetical protein
MNPELKGVWEHILEQATGALAHANRHSCYSDPDKPWWKQQAVLQAAHAAELMIKARIAQEHPLLIFETLPRPLSGQPALMDIKDLFERGKTYQWNELPARLWATTGLRLSNEERFQSFGRLRNMIQHFNVPAHRDIGGETIDFVFGVLDPFMNECWSLCAIDYDEDDSPYEYLTAAVVGRELLFNVSARAARAAGSWYVNWDSMTPKYRKEMVRRVDAAWANSESQGLSADLEKGAYGTWQHCKASHPERQKKRARAAKSASTKRPGRKSTRI